VSTPKEDLRAEAKAARTRVVGTVGELGTAITAAKADAVGTAKRFAPLAGGAVAGLVLLKLRSLVRK
jgi:hypothetical protein